MTGENQPAKTPVKAASKKKQSRAGQTVRRNKKAKKPRVTTVYKTIPMIAKQHERERVFMTRVVENSLLLNKDYLYPRHDGDPTCSKLIPWVTRIPLNQIDATGRTSFKIHPDPDRLVEFINPPTAGNSPKDPQEVLAIDTHMANPTYFFNDKDLTMITGNVVSEHAGSDVKGLDVGVYYSGTDKTFKPGVKYYRTGPFVAQLPWEALVHNKGNADLTVVCEIILILRNNEGGLEAGTTASVTQIVAPGQLGTGQFAPWGQMQNDSGAANVVGFANTFRCSVAGQEDTIANHQNEFGIIWPFPAGPGASPIFNDSYTWISKSLWDIKGTSTNSLRAEWETANTVAVTGCDFNVANVTADLNLNGDLLGAVIRRFTSRDPPADPGALYSFIDGLPLDGTRMKDPIKTNKGVHSVLPLSDEDCQLLPISVFSKLSRQTTAANARPFFVVSIICDSPITPGTKPALSLSGTIHLEWRTSSILCNPNRPPTNVALFNQIRHQEMMNSDNGSIWSENPEHIKNLKKLAKNIVSSKMFKTVLRDVAVVGIESVAAMLLV